MSSYLTENDIATCRDVIDGVLPSTATLETQTVVSDGGGGRVTTWTASGTVSARIDPLGFGSERVTGDRLAPNANFVITLPAETPVDTDSRVIIDDEDYEVVAIRAPLSWELSRRVEVNKVAE